MLQKLEEKAMIKFLQRFDKVPFTVKFKDAEYSIGEGQPQFSVFFKEPLPVTKLLTNTSITLGEAYMDGNIEIDHNFFEVLTYILSQDNKFTSEKSRFTKFMAAASSKSKQAADVRKHYDIGNDFYKLWLDSTMSYSCAYFKDPNDTLEQAQQHKIDYILEKLYLKEGMNLLDIGCGWGSILIAAAKKYKVKGVGITLSQQQYEKFTKQIIKEDLEDLLTVRLMDYRDLPELNQKFQRIVSVGMLEHVGRTNYPAFIDSATKVLDDGGLFLLHFISQVKEVSDYGWIQKYIFPGGEIPSLREIIHLMSDSNMRVLDVEDLRRHYTKTLLCWAQNFMDKLPEVRQMFDEKFIRMWKLYLYGCAAAFWVGNIEIHQVLLSKGINNDLPMTRWY